MKVLDRYKIWPWSQQGEFLKPFLKFSNTDSNISKQSFLKPQESMDHIEEQQEEVSQPLRQTGPVPAPISATPVQPQQETPKISRKRKSDEASSQPSSVQVLTYLEKRNNNSALEDIDLIMMGYARSIKQFSPRRQTMAELAQQTEDDQHNEGTRSGSFATFSGSSLLSPIESGTYLQPTPEATSPAVWYDDFGSSLDSNYQYH
ncbi:hypothetical protein CBL_02910 [Carabus blaptoides fortunei]